jgi:Tol biopolymer transport system component/DNA-binding winged helix-turn-helix (wHTH) protein
VAPLSPASRQIRFGEFILDLDTAELRKNGYQSTLQGQPFQILQILVERPGSLVTRDELKKRLWPSDTFVDFDQGLNKAIKRLREALEDSADHPRFIETLPRRGYRFIGTLDGAGMSHSSPADPNKFTAAGPRRTQVAAAMIVLLFLFIASLAIWWRASRSPGAPAVEVVPLIALQGMQFTPAFSPDGNQVAFAGLVQPNAPGIYTTLVDGEKVLRLTDNSGDCCPTWSPDSRRIAFVRYSDSTKEMSFYEISAFGGAEHKLYTGQANFRRGGARMDWSPDGKFIAFSEPASNGLESRIALLSLSDLSMRPLTSPLQPEYDCEPVFSPDGTMVAFARGSHGGNRRDLFIIPVSGGRPRQITFGHSNESPVWTQNGKEIVFSSQLGGLSSLWRVSASGGAPRPVSGVGAVALKPSVARKGNELVYEHVVSSESIWRLDLEDEKHSVGASERIISSRGINSRPDVSPDGTKIVFESDRLGYSDIWYCNSNGTNCSQLTSLHGTAGAPRWSPDGHFIVFEFQSQGFYQLYVLELPGGQPRLVPTVSGADSGAPSWSRDGQWIYFYSNREKGPFQLWKVPARGGSPIRVTKNGGVHGIESVDGRFLFYSKLEQPGLWLTPLDGSEEQQILDQPPGFDWHSWAPVPNGIYYLDVRDPRDAKISFFDLRTHKSTPIIGLKPAPSYHGLTVSPNGRSIFYTQFESADSYVMLVKNFR